MISDNIRIIEERIARGRIRAGGDPSCIVLVAVTKNRTASLIREALAAGIRDLGENRVQEACVHKEEVSALDSRLSPVQWHMIGHLQTNKVKDAVRIFDLIHSVDSAHLAGKIQEHAHAIAKVQDILIEVNTSKESTKFGIPPEGLAQLVQEIAQLKNVRLRGLMTMAPEVGDPESARPYFKLLRELRDRVNELRITDSTLPVLSMGMSGDFEIAVEEGATMVRIGRAIFE